MRGLGKIVSRLTAARRTMQAANANDDGRLKGLTGFGTNPGELDARIYLPSGEPTALFLGDLIDALRRHGWEIISADGAFADPIYRSLPETPYAAGTLAEALAWEKWITGPRWYERNNTRTANALFAERVLHEKAQ